MDEQIKEAVENTVNTVVETGLQKAADTTTEIAQKALETVSEPETNWGVKNALIGTGIGLGGAAIGYATRQWVIPWAKKKLSEAKTKRAQKKAEKAAKKAAKQAGQKNNTQTPEALAADPKFDPMTVTTEIDNV